MRKMKDSGIEWIGEIPAEWAIIKLKFVFSIIGGNGFPDSLQGKENGDYPFCKVSDINGKSEYVDGAMNWVSHSTAKTNGFNIIPVGSIIMAKTGAALAKNHRKINRIECCIDNNTQALINRRNDCIRYLYYLTKCIDMGWFDNNCTVPSVNNSKLLNFYLPDVSISEQSRIADYLDEKCGEINRYIEKQQQIIEKLKAYKQAVITEAVTKGLDPSVPMKDSGIEWIGMIPEHWNIRRLRYLGTCVNGLSKGGEYFGSGHPFVSYGDVYKNMELPHTVDGLVESTINEREWYSVKEGDVFFTRTSETIEEVALTSTCMQTIEDATFAGFLIRFRPNTNLLLKEFSKYYFRRSKHRLFFVKEMNLVTRASLSQELLKRLPVLLPPTDEQKIITLFLDRKCDDIDSAIRKKQSLIESIIEYKKSLIYEAVTGKLEA